VSQPLSLLSIPAAWLTAIIPEVYKVCTASLVPVRLTNLPLSQAKTLQNTQGFKFDP
jgi:hypothetical protein